MFGIFDAEAVTSTLKRAVKTWVGPHTVFATLDERRLWRDEIEPSCNILQLSTSAEDFQGRYAALEAH